MRPPAGIFLIIAIGLGTAACSGSGGSTASHLHSGAGAGAASGAVNSSTHKNDRDNDGDENDDDGRYLYYGHAADAADRRVSTALITRYFAAAAAENGARACALLVPLLTESVVEENGHSPALRGRTCAVVMSKLFKLHHRLLAEKSASLRVIAVRVEGYKGLVIFEFPEIPEVRLIAERRVHGTWRVMGLLDSILE